MIATSRVEVYKIFTEYPFVATHLDGQFQLLYDGAIIVAIPYSSTQV